VRVNMYVDGYVAWVSHLQWLTIGCSAHGKRDSTQRLRPCQSRPIVFALYLCVDVLTLFDGLANGSGASATQWSPRCWRRRATGYKTCSTASQVTGPPKLSYPLRQGYPWLGYIHMFSAFHK